MWRDKLARHIIVVAYDPRWVEQYNSEALKIKGILQDNCVTIHHIGSTAVKGLYAKPIIDIMPVVHSLEEVDGVNTEFEKIGYENIWASSESKDGAICAKAATTGRIIFIFFAKTILLI